MQHTSRQIMNIKNDYTWPPDEKANSINTGKGIIQQHSIIPDESQVKQMTFDLLFILFLVLCGKRQPANKEEALFYHNE